MLQYNRNKRIDTKKLEDDENLKKLARIMGQSGLKGQLDKARDILNSKDYSIDDIKHIIKELKSQYEILKKLEFQTPKFIDGLTTPEQTQKSFDKFKDDFKEMLIGRLNILIKCYEDYNSSKKKVKKNIKSFDNTFSVVKFEENRPKIKNLKIEKLNKFRINYPYVALISDSDIQKIQFGFSSYNLNIGPIITSFYSGAVFTYNIVSFIDKNLLVKLIFNEEGIDDESKKLISCFSIKAEIPPTEPIPISFTVPSSSKNTIYTLFGILEIKIDNSEIKPLLIDFTFNIILLPLEVCFESQNQNLFWNENKLNFKTNSFKEGDIFKFDFYIRNFSEDYSFLNKV